MFSVLCAVWRAIPLYRTRTRAWLLLNVLAAGSSSRVMATLVTTPGAGPAQGQLLEHSRRCSEAPEPDGR
jgi:hypothetical protein